jgi:peptidyl-prolyl cis-trans isomerase D
MFDFVRNNHKLIQVVLALIAVPFAFFGVEFYVRNSDRTAEAASVAGQTITQTEFSQAVRRQQDQLRGMLGRNYDPDRFDTVESRQMLINSLIDNRLIASETVRGHLTVSDDALRDLIMGIPAFVVDGKFSKDRYQQIATSQNMTPLQFDETLRTDAAQRQLTESIESTDIVSRTALAQWQTINEQERDVEEAQIQPAQFLANAKVTPEAEKEYYDSNGKLFEEPLQVTAEYVVLSADKLAQQVTVTEDQLKAWYDAHLAQLASQEKRQARHILVASPKAAPPADRAKARAKAESLLADVRKSPGSFAEIAKKNSDDPGSAAKGGDLGEFGRGMMVKPFEDTVFNMKPGQISGVVETDFGYHIIKLETVKGATFDNMHADIEREVRKQEGQKKFAEVAESFNNLVYDQPDSLQPAVDRFKLPLQRSAMFAKRDAAQAVPALNNDRMLTALFSDDTVKNKHNTEAIETAPYTLISARVVESKPARIRSLGEVKPSIDLILQTKEATSLARQHAEAVLAELKKGGTGEGVTGLKWGPTKIVSRQNPLDLRKDAIDAIFHADATKLPAYAIAEAGQSGVQSVFRIAKVTQAQIIDTDKRKQRDQQLTATMTREDYDAYLAALRAKSKVVVNTAAVDRKDR